MRVLLVDDDPGTLKLFKSILNYEGFEAETASNGQEALDKARTDPPALVISDILMPVMDGFALCRAWQEDPGLRAIPFIFSSGVYKSFKDEGEGLALGAAAYIRKPTDPASLLAVIRYFLRENPAARETKAEAGPFKPVALKPYNVDMVQSLERQAEDLTRALEALRESEKTYRELYEGALGELGEVRAVALESRETLSRAASLLEAFEGNAAGSADTGEFSLQMREQIGRLTGLLERLGPQGPPEEEGAD